MLYTIIVTCWMYLLTIWTHRNLLFNIYTIISSNHWRSDVKSRIKWMWCIVGHCYMFDCVIGRCICCEMLIINSQWQSRPQTHHPWTDFIRKLLLSNCWISCFVLLKTIAFPVYNFHNRCLVINFIWLICLLFYCFVSLNFVEFFVF